MAGRSGAGGAKGNCPVACTFFPDPNSTHSISDALAHALAQPLAYPLTHSLTRALAHPLARPLRGLSNESAVGVTMMYETAKSLGVPPAISIQNDYSLIYRWALVGLLWLGAEG